MAISNTHLKMVQLGEDQYYVSAKYLLDNSGNEHTFEEIASLHNLEIRAVSILPEPSAQTLNAIYLVPSSGSSLNIKNEYITILDNDNFVWELIGTTETDLSNYATLAHTHTVTPNSTKLSATASGTAVGANGTTSAVTGYESPVTDQVLGTGTTFSTTVTPQNTNVRATASGTALSTNNDSFVKSYPGVSSKLVTTSIKGVSGTTSVATVTNSGSKTNGTASSWSANVDANGVLSFSFTANTPTAVTLPTFGSATVATADANATTVATGTLASNGGGGAVLTGLGTATTANALTSASVSTQPTITLATGASAGTGVVSLTAGIASASTTAGTNDQVSALTGLGAATTSTVLTGVKVTAQPTVTIASGSTGDVTVAAATAANTGAAIQNS